MLKQAIKSVLPKSSQRHLLALHYRIFPRAYVRANFVRHHGYRPNLNNPKTFSEKLAYRRMRERNPLFELCSNKFTVRKYVESKLDTDISIELYGHHKQITAKTFERLPEDFVIKTSHGSGNNDIVTKGVGFDGHQLAEKYNRLINSPSHFSWKYNRLPADRYILIEKLMLDENGCIPSDYKFHCFNHSEHGFNYFLQVDSDRYNDQRQDIFDKDLNRLDLCWSDLPTTIGSFDCPSNYREMVEIARQLSADFKYVRVDLYNIKGKIYFGELTFMHRAGFSKITPREWDDKLGELWEIGS